MMDARYLLTFTFLSQELSAAKPKKKMVNMVYHLFTQALLTLGTTYIIFFSANSRSNSLRQQLLWKC